MSVKVLDWKQKEWAYDQWCNGKTQSQIADALNVSVKTVCRALQGRPKIRPVLVYPEGSKS